MKTIICKDYEEVSKVAADFFEKQIKEKSDSKICFATGSSPIKTYQNLINKVKENRISFKDVTTFNLDEYVGIPYENKCSYHYFMDDNLFNHIDLKRENINFPEGLGNLVENAKKYENKIRELGGIDFMILGIGTNAHIAFNEPGSKKDERTREVKLTQSTINSNKIYFDNPNDIPKTAVSMGIGTILEAKKIILIASGKSKADAIYKTLNSPISEEVPSSFLREHKDVTLIIDEDAASLL
ncbi:glucosamine-6-phosphate deaminase [Mycoplasma anserisalpingitidis]|uniref:Glucosamine-6-phosphate deaminase n=1 Tax=Mycoplasma anserisalpingitidis TaxID=519450 RepID=A0A5B8K7I1_9MOLU|nr:glucosamine-6-phosphate deaminase [Mycoplasma anserisalpingitidis]QDY86847.1 glucosamine-6-phosphate deaminase [Mycoplasma anserisalpingitidis]